MTTVTFDCYDVNNDVKWLDGGPDFATFIGNNTMQIQYPGPSTGLSRWYTSLFLTAAALSPLTVVLPTVIEQFADDISTITVTWPSIVAVSAVLTVTSITQSVISGNIIVHGNQSIPDTNPIVFMSANFIQPDRTIEIGDRLEFSYALD